MDLLRKLQFDDFFFGRLNDLLVQASEELGAIRVLVSFNNPRH